MRSSARFGLAACAVLVAASACAGEILVVSDLRGPEGPLYLHGNLYYAGWASSTLSKWDGGKSTVLNSTPGCGHNGLALTRQRTFLVACADHGAILELTMTGKQLRRWDADSRGKPFDGGINDIVVAANGGAYATNFGQYTTNVEPPTAVIGRIVYRAPGTDKWVEVAGDLNFANGIGVSPDQKTLYVSETVGSCILQFSINSDGTLSHRAKFALLNLLVKNRVDSWWLGPDSMKIDRRGNIYVAQWTGAKVLILSPGGKLLHVFDISAGAGTTNVAFDEGERDLYVTVVKNPDDPQAKGSIVRIPNVE